METSTLDTVIITTLFFITPWVLVRESWSPKNDRVPISGAKHRCCQKNMLSSTRHPTGRFGPVAQWCSGTGASKVCLTWPAGPSSWPSARGSFPRRSGYRSWRQSPSRGPCPSRNTAGGGLQTPSSVYSRNCYTPTRSLLARSRLSADCRAYRGRTVSYDYRRNNNVISFVRLHHYHTNERARTPTHTR